MVPIYENYKDYSAPEGIQAIVSKILSSLPERYLSGLQSVVLTNSAVIGKGKTQRLAGRKYTRRDCLGFYSPKWTTRAAYIQLVVDNILADATPYSTPERDLTEYALAYTLFHEIGHHLDYTTGASGRGGEVAANEWMRRLFASYVASTRNRLLQNGGNLKS